MLLPLSHEDQTGRRWPFVTIAIIVLNIAVFLGTHYKIDDESSKLVELKIKILLLSANHPRVEAPVDVKPLIENFQRSNKKMWDYMGRRDRRVEPSLGKWDIQMREFDDVEAGDELGVVAGEYKAAQSASVIESYAFYNYKHDVYRYFSASFLHGGWFHLIFNMWFLWLAGAKMEDVWGRPIYSAFYAAACVVSLMAHAAVMQNSIAPLIGASGAVAALMGAFLVRFMKTKIHFVFIYFLGIVPRFWRFAAPAFVMLPLWLLTQIFWASLSPEGDGVAYWAHIGGFAFGAVVTLGLKASGVEHAVDKAIEAEVTCTADPRIHTATELIAQNHAPEAVAELRQLISEKPEMVEAHSLMVTAQMKAQDYDGLKETLAILCRLHIKSKELDVALQNYDEFCNAGGEKIGASEWQAICRHLETLQCWERAATEYEKLAHAYPADRISVSALISAARVRLKRLNDKSAAARLYQEAEASPVPHLDWDDAIRMGLKEAKA
ncbi:MAG: rhomboid family intramembrane serine protease [Acidobacteria bacterium]|nr:rhomboid family intramembrane serine protease [Acidobacteriota bacterium]